MDDEQRKLAEEALSQFHPQDDTSKSFCKKLFYGIYDNDPGFSFSMPPKANSQEIEDFVAKVDRFAAESIDAAAIDRNGEIPPAVIEGLKKLGVMGMTVSKEWGGLGMSQGAYCKVAEVLASHCASTALFVSVHQSIGLKGLILFGTKNQCDKWLKKLSLGEMFAAFSLTEPNAGSDASGVETKAIYDKEKKTYTINGIKQWTTNGSIADLLTVMAKTEIETPKGVQEKITAFLVPSKTEGFEVTAKKLDKVGMRGTKTANLKFTNMVIPEENILGEKGAGLRICLTVLDYGRTTFGAMCTGSANYLLSLAKEHARTRIQFKKPLCEFELVKDKLARIAALNFAMEATTYFTAGLIDAGVEDIMLESAILKVFTSEALWEIIYETMQIYGGRSLFTDAPLERMMRDARLNMIGEGSNDVLRAFIGAVGLREVGLDLKGFFAAFLHPVNEFNTISRMSGLFFQWIKRPKVAVKSKSLEKVAKQLAKSVHKFSVGIAKLLIYYRESVAERQLELARLADMAIALYTVSAVINKMDAAKEDNLAGMLYCQMALKKFDETYQSLFSSFDEMKCRASDALIKGVSK